MDDREAVIVSARRTPFGRRRGGLSTVHPAELLAGVHAAALESAGLTSTDVDLVLTGAVTKIGEQAYNIGRIAVLTGGMPVEVPAVTLDAQCGSSQQAVNMAASSIAAGTADIVLASGVESMSRVPLGSDRELGAGDPLTDRYREQYPVVSAGESAEMIAEKWGISRAECDEFAWNSHQRALRARAAGAFDAEIAPVVAEDGVRVTADEPVRDSSLDDLRALKPAFRADGFHTAASSSPITDGAAAVVVMSAAAARARGLRPLARIAGQSIVGVDPTLRLTGPIPVTRALLDSTGLTLDDIDLFEVNEAFASVVLAWLREYDVDPARVNRNGGAIALGHPVGATGARLVTTAVHDLVRTGARRALVAMCTGGGLGTGTVLERIAR
ncbi:acetyl-CoA acyltransferase [Acrocarpospora pleiomorpha]|uniref:Acetyl-CoA acyltransferase n=1 Tax=Acrocarpospora pleiomorpha TaxID=90975 RepID=A0A5M3X868_9ACTN|nr:thiolase family protein [Acrocarpospora pleiomorpha]GES17304.1 acetyl-CoA acyltransferase [Acrocarpospora pleiomorpha]